MAYNKDNDKLIFKFNGGRGAVLCSNCFCVMYEGKYIPAEYTEAICNDKQKEFGPAFCCETCKQEWQDTYSEQ